MDTEEEKLIGSLKGIASIIFMMNEVPEGGILWNEYAKQMLCEKLRKNIEILEGILKERL